jgi:outer membrane protein
MNKLLLISFLLILSNFSNGQNKTWSLEDCIACGNQSGTERKIKELEIAQQEALKPSQWSNLLPRVDFSGYHSYNFGSTIDPETNTRVSSNFQTDQFYLSSNITLFSMYDIQKTKLDQLKIERSKIELQVLALNFDKLIIDAYFNCLAAQELFSLYQIQTENSSLESEHILKEVELGNRPKSDSYTIQWEQSNMKVRLLEAELAFSARKKELAQLLQVELDSEVRFQLLPASSSNNVSENPTLKLRSTEILVKQKEIQLAKSLKKPSLQAYYNYSTFYYNQMYPKNKLVDPLSMQLNNNGYQQIGLSLQVPIFDGFRNNRAIQTAQIGFEIAKIKQELETTRLQQEASAYHQEIYLLKAAQEHLKQGLSLAKESLKSSKTNFELGQIDIQTYTLLKNNYLNSELALLKNTISIWHLEKRLFLLGDIE